MAESCGEVDLGDFLARTTAWVDGALRRWLPDPERDRRQAELAAAMAHIVFSGGKRLRPALVRLGCQDAGGADDDALAAAAAVELLHAYSLVHDDLPCMDDATLRRGRPCVHVLHGEATAVLAGDALLTLAFEVLARHTPAGRPVGTMVATLGRVSGWDGMVGGQMLDLAAEGQPADIERVRSIHAGKTAALLGGCLALGGLAGGGDAERVSRLERAGRALGLAFQIVDDLLDLEGDAAALGKDAGADAENEKMTWPGVVGVAQARDDARRLAEEARELLADGPAAALFAALCERVLGRGH